MCGICGLAASDGARTPERDLLERLADTLRHRGPDGSGYFAAPGIGLAMRRLAVVDLETGDQPIASEDGTIAVICNGEIYNAPELRRELEGRGHVFRTRSDVEPIVHLYEERGAECLDALRGMFALALWDGRRRRLLLARDRFGIKPLLWAEHRDGLLFASEAKALLPVLGAPSGPDPAAVRDLFAFGFVTAPRTFFPGIHRLPAGHLLICEGGRAAVRRWWGPRFPLRGEEDHAKSPAAWARLVREKLEESVRIHLRSDVPLSVQLSAGIDSSSVAALALRLTAGPIETFTLAFAHAACDELAGRRILSDFDGYDLPNRRAVCGPGDLVRLPEALWHQEDPTTSGLEIPRLLLAELAARRFKVVLTGEGADELFGGYPWYRIDRFLRPFAALPRPLRTSLGHIAGRWRPMVGRGLEEPRGVDLRRYVLMAGAWTPEHDNLLAPGLAPPPGWMPGLDPGVAPPPQFRLWHPFSQLRYLDQTVRLPDFIAHLLDRSTMAKSLEARVPFLDHELAELTAAVPPRIAMRLLQEKALLRRAVQDLLPAEIARRKKRGMTAPVHEWLAGTLPEFAEELLSPRAIAEKGYFVPGAVETLLRQHRRGRRGGIHLIGVLSVQLWDEIFVRGRR
ncbi:MAG: asparagine synthase (glutamine-hydrolyzing) [Candidatus Methylomirabilia bacterium]